MSKEHLSWRILEWMWQQWPCRMLAKLDFIPDTIEAWFKEQVTPWILFIAIIASVASLLILIVGGVIELILAIVSIFN